MFPTFQVRLFGLDPLADYDMLMIDFVSVCSRMTVMMNSVSVCSHMTVMMNSVSGSVCAGVCSPRSKSVCSGWTPQRTTW